MIISHETVHVLTPRCQTEHKNETAVMALAYQEQVLTIHKENTKMSTVLTYIGILVFLLFVLGWPIMAYHQYRQSSYYNKAAFVGIILLTLCAIAALLLFILTITNILNTNNPTILIVAWFDAQILVNWWTSPDEKWVLRRKRRRSFIIMLVLSIILAVALVGSLIINL